MNFTSNISDNLPVLVAPRPVRLTASSLRLRPKHSQSQHDRSLSSDYRCPFYQDTPSDRERPPSSSSSSSPRSSPRSGLPTEALEEFLSILKPSFFQPSSPRIRRHTQPAFQQERPPVILKPHSLIDPPCTSVEEIDHARSASGGTTGRDTPDSPLEFDPSITNTPPIRWFSARVLSSPISRNQTRNPFLRHLHDQSPIPMPVMSPAAVPLPLPTPDEFLEI